MKTLLSSFAGTILAFLLIVAIGGGYAACVSGKKPKVEDGSWLVIELYGDLLEYDPPGGVMSELAGGEAQTLQRVLDNLDKARVDERIEGVVFRVAMGSSMGGGKAEEIRAAIRRLQDSGKKVLGYAESFALPEYLLLAACDEIVVPETAYIGFVGLSANTMHVKNMLEKIGIKPNIHKIKDYKSAAELVTREDMSDPSREMRGWMLDEFWATLTATLAEDRGLDEATILRHMEHAQFTAGEAHEAGLVDRVAYWDEVEDLLRGEEEELETVSGERYADVPPDKVGLEGDRTIAVIHAQGTIAGRKNDVNPLLGLTMGHETIVAELRRAREDEDVAAVILRVDSGGGDALGSDLMGHEVERTTAEKPVVVSMVDVAASGGYHISYRANAIVADAMTVTGSIGSISGKFNMAGLYDKLGISFDHVTRGPNALMDSDSSDYTEEQRARFEDDHWKGFNHWLQDVADHRGMSFEEAEKLAHGRVWTGRQAKENGLIDEIGDLHHAVEVAKRLAEIPADEQVTVAHFPEKKSLLESLLGGESDTATAAHWLVWRVVREDVAETWQLLQSNPSLVMEGPLP